MILIENLKLNDISFTLIPYACLLVYGETMTSIEIKFFKLSNFKK